jgi:hypothetical protein
VEKNQVEKRTILVFQTGHLTHLKGSWRMKTSLLGETPDAYIIFLVLGFLIVSLMAHDGATIRRRRGDFSNSFK